MPCSSRRPSLFMMFPPFPSALPWAGYSGLDNFLALSCLARSALSCCPVSTKNHTTKSSLMKVPQIIQQKIYDLPRLQHQLRRWKLLSKTIAFTNGCFDILHRGHIASLSDAAREAGILIVGLNSDASTRRLKGDDRPINSQD